MISPVLCLLAILATAHADCLPKAEVKAQAAQLGQAFDAAVLQALSTRGLTLVRPTLQLLRGPGAIVVPLREGRITNLGEIVGEGESAGRVVGQLQTTVAVGGPSFGPTTVTPTGQPWQDVAIIATDTAGNYHVLSVMHPTREVVSCSCSGSMGVAHRASQIVYLLPADLPGEVWWRSAWPRPCSSP